jgi:dipeptidyl aminopeptidase/acylaminoacyl peptidase
MTEFVAGHSYAEAGFSTLTTLIDMPTGRIITDLEKFEVFRDGTRIASPDFNFWGVTFARDSNRFYATLGTGGKTYLVEGDVSARRARVLRENVECPSLSPDNKRIAFKKRDGSLGMWRLHILDLATLEDRPLEAETRIIDDQVEWLDDNQILYRWGQDVIVVPTDGSAPPRIFLARASSPAVVR